jgi:hypothetical protein
MGTKYRLKIHAMVTKRQNFMGINRRVHETSLSQIG